MATIKAVSSKASIAIAINYTNNPKKILDSVSGRFLVSGIFCNPKTAIEEMKTTKEIWGKTDGRQYKHFAINFHKNEKVTATEAFDMAVQLAEERFPGFEVLVTTHTDKDHIHSHIIVNSVSFEDGHKYRESKHALQEMKNRHDELCRERGLSVTEKGKGFDGQPKQQVTTYGEAHVHKTINDGTMKPGTSWKVDISYAAIRAKNVASSREEFISILNKKGYKVRWEGARKQITFTDKDGKSVRSGNIEKSFGSPFSKEALESVFEARAKTRNEIATLTEAPEAETRPDAAERMAVTDRQAAAAAAVGSKPLITQDKPAKMPELEHKTSPEDPAPIGATSADVEKPNEDEIILDRLEIIDARIAEIDEELNNAFLGGNIKGAFGRNSHLGDEKRDLEAEKSRLTSPGQDRQRAARDKRRALE